MDFTDPVALKEIAQLIGANPAILFGVWRVVKVMREWQREQRGEMRYQRAVIDATALRCGVSRAQLDRFREEARNGL